MNAHAVRGIVLLALLAATPAGADNADPHVAPPGSEKTPVTKALGLGAELLQTQSPPSGLDAYLVGFHPMKDDPEHQVESHHFCRQVNEDFAQCALFDGNGPEANLNGIEYIISEKLFATLPPGEREYWHPHNYEILSGQLTGPGLPDVAEMRLMKGKMNSYGKTWHVWNTGHFGMDDADTLPLGESRLAWSFNQDGEALPGLVETMEERVGVDTGEQREARQQLVALAKAQEGVDALKGKFKRPVTPIPGVTATAPRP